MLDGLEHIRERHVRRHIELDEHSIAVRLERAVVEQRRVHEGDRLVVLCAALVVALFHMQIDRVLRRIAFGIGLAQTHRVVGEGERCSGCVVDERHDRITGPECRRGIVDRDVEHRLQCRDVGHANDRRGHRMPLLVGEFRARGLRIQQ